MMLGWGNSALVISEPILQPEPYIPASIMSACRWQTCPKPFSITASTGMKQHALPEHHRFVTEHSPSIQMANQIFEAIGLA